MSIPNGFYVIHQPKHRIPGIYDLHEKLFNAINDRKEAIRKELVRKNKPWIDMAIPGLVHGFHYDLYDRVEDRLFEEYKRLGGKDSENEMIRKAMLFYRIYLNESQDLMLKANGDQWKDDDEIWECWTGFAGSEEEARRICKTLDAGFRPLAGETTIH